MFQFTRLPLRFFTSEYPGMTRDGFPHSGILGCACQTANRGLSQSCHALLRLLDPRHPPQTLSNLTHIWAHSQIALLFLRTGFSCKRCFVSRAVPRPPPALGSPPLQIGRGFPRNQRCSIIGAANGGVKPFCAEFWKMAILAKMRKLAKDRIACARRPLPFSPRHSHSPPSFPRKRESRDQRRDTRESGDKPAKGSFASLGARASRQHSRSCARRSSS